MNSTPSDNLTTVHKIPSRVMIRTWGGILWLLVFVSLLVMWGTANSSVVSQALPSGSVGIPEAEPVKLVQRKVAPFQFTERSGREISQKDLQGKPWVVNFIFTSCVMSCPANTTAMMKLAQQAKDLNVQFVTITVDPERDTPERLRDYAEIYGADPDKWWFLTGEKEEIHALIKNNFLQSVEEKQGKDRLLGYEFAHSDRFMHIGPDGTILGYYLATDPAEMVKLRRVLAGEMETPEENRFLVPASFETSVQSDAEEKSEMAESETSPADPAQTTEPAGVEEVAEIPGWVETLPLVNALLNSLATVLLVTGFLMIMQKKVKAHQTCMISAFAVSVVFLGCYLTYHFSLQYYTGASSKKFPNLGFVRQVYLTILISHIILAAGVPVLTIGTLYQAYRKQWDRHRFWASITFPIWLYVSVTGVVIYVMLYQLPAVLMA